MDRAAAAAPLRDAPAPKSAAPLTQKMQKMLLADGGRAPVRLVYDEYVGWGVRAARDVPAGRALFGEPVIAFAHPAREGRDILVVNCSWYTSSDFHELYSRANGEGEAAELARFNLNAYATGKLKVTEEIYGGYPHYFGPEVTKYNAGLVTLAVGFLASRINHCCAPNAHVRVDVAPDGMLRLIVTALRDITQMEEVTTSYISIDERDIGERRSALAVYGIVCTCRLCTGTY